MAFSLFKKTKNLTTTTKSFLENIPKIEIDSRIPGPTIFITSGIHGDEIAANVILLKLCNYFKKNNLKKGKIIALVGINQSGMNILKREIPETDEDLNRLFPGNPAGTIGQKIANMVAAEIEKSKPELVIDLHNDYFFSTPYILLDAEKNSNEETYKKTIEFAKSSTLPVIQESDNDFENFKNTLSAYCVSQGIPSFTLESGPDKLILSKYVNQVTDSLLHILLSQNMIDKNKNISKKTKVARKVLNYGVGLKVENSGVVKYIAEAGDFVKKNSTVAKVYDQFGENLINVLAPYDAYVLGHSEKINVESGEEIYWFAHTN
jgi:predicted deacylase